ncbi:MAG: octaprenyl diphosphate synthase [Gammaproteobacteria bacterium]|nr:MAG: octaprenyl diphosphate synthase [Gammaproteobacteria bacterium]
MQLSIDNKLQDELDDLMTRVDSIIYQNLKSDVVLINNLSTYIIKNGGKRLRPRLVLLSALLCDYQGDKHYLIAAIIEFIHTATLLHDDVVDESSLRRGAGTANQIWGNSAAILVGDFLYSRSFQMMVKTDSMAVMQILSHTTNIIAEGEVMQLLNINNCDITVAQYLATIKAKTSKLFESATELGASLANIPQKQQQNLGKFGNHLGTAFQLVDDILDYDIDNKKIGKNIGDDLSEGKPTLPLIYALQDCKKSSQDLIKKAIKEADIKYLDDILQILKDNNSLQKCQKLAKEQITLAISCLDGFSNDNQYKQSLINIASLSVSRTF